MKMRIEDFLDCVINKLREESISLGGEISKDLDYVTAMSEVCTRRLNGHILTIPRRTRESAINAFESATLVGNKKPFTAVEKLTITAGLHVIKRRLVGCPTFTEHAQDDRETHQTKARMRSMQSSVTRF